MMSPTLLGPKRHLHKRGHKAKKKDSFKRQSKDVRSQGNTHPPRITQKRLTNKSGFCFKGALNTSPLSRGSKGRENKKAKKGSADFDLFCLLKAAKSKIIKFSNYSALGCSLRPYYQESNRDVFQSSTGQPPPASGSTSSVLDSSCTFVGSVVEDSNGKINPSKTKSYHIPEKKRRGESKPQSSSESNVSSLTENHRRGDIQHISSNDCDPYHDGFDMSNQGGGLHNTSPTIEHHQFNTKKVDDKAPQAMLKPCSLSSYQKFAVRIVQAMLPEKKRQFPSQGCLATTGEDLCNIYNKTHSKQLKDRVDKTEHSLPQNYTSHEMSQNIATKMKKTERTECFKSKKQAVKCGEPPLTHPQEDKSFKEKSVKAWVDAISENVPTKHCEKLANMHPSKQNNKLSNSTEVEFLKNFMDNTSGFKALPVEVGSVPFWTQDNTDEFSPFAPPIPKQSLRCQRILTSIGKQPQDKSRHSKVPWFTEKMEHHIEEMESPISPGFLFDPSILPQGKANHSYQISNNMDGAMKRNKHDNSLFSWSIFSKHPKLDKHQVSLPTHPKVNYYSKQNEDLESIKFSPRFMLSR